MIESSDLRLTKMPLNNGAGYMPALGFGTLIPDTAVTKTATRDALDAGFRHAVGTSHTDIRTTMNIYGDVVTDEMTTAGAKVCSACSSGKWQRKAQRD